MNKLFCVFALALGVVACSPQTDHLTILHTNDTHSQVAPKSNGQGGYARRMGLIAQERALDKNLLLLDAGDFSQGTPYFNFFHGRVEIDALDRMGYDAATLGNHEFDNGLDTLAMVVRRANFPIVCANYDFTGTVLEGLIKPYTIIRRAGLKIGIFGIGCQPKGLISDKNFLPAKYNEPYPVAQQMADLLHSKNCDVVICLSHQGTFAESEGNFNDVDMAGTTRGIDVIIGGHTHQVHDHLRIANLDGDSIPVLQMGKSGVKLGKIVLNIAHNE